MMEDNNTDKGSAIATLVAEAYIISSKMIYHSNPFPIRSSMYLNKNSISSTNITIKKVTMKGLMKDLINKRCIFFIKTGNRNNMMPLIEFNNGINGFYYTKVGIIKFFQAPSVLMRYSIWLSHISLRSPMASSAAKSVMLRATSLVSSSCMISISK